VGLEIYLPRLKLWKRQEFPAIWAKDTGMVTT